ncbi:MAG: nucleotide sugar dehydrogenase [Candidatus Bathyarchaeia archaeon]
MASPECTKTLEMQNNRFGNLTIGIVGCNRVGVLHACLLAEAGFKVLCVDTDQAAIERISKGKTNFLKHEIEPLLRKNLETGKLKPLNDFKAVAAQSGVLVIAVPATVNKRNDADYSVIERVLKNLSSNMRRETLILIVSTVGIGATEGFLKNVLENASGLKAGTGFYLAYSPVPFQERQTLKTLPSCKRIVAAIDKKSLDFASNILGSITKSEIVKTLNLKAAEAAVLFETVHRYTQRALAREFAVFCDKTGVDYLAVQNLFSATVDSELGRQTLFCESGCDECQLLLNEAENLNVKLRVSTAALDVNEEFSRHALNLIRDVLKNCGKALRRAKISILGVSQTPNAMDVPKSCIIKLEKDLSLKGAKITFYDPYFLGKPPSEMEKAIFKKSLAESVEGADCIVIFTGHDQFKRLNLRRIKLLTRMPTGFVDFEGVLDPSKVEAEGFIYRGFGRGVLKNE